MNSVNTVPKAPVAVGPSQPPHHMSTNTNPEVPSPHRSRTLAPSTRVFAYPDGRVVFGERPDAVVLNDVLPEDIHWIRRMLNTLPLRLPQQVLVGDAATVKRRRALWEQVEHLVTTQNRDATVPGMAGERIADDARALCAADPLATEESTRHLRTVWIDGLDRCGMAIAFGLAAAGIGRILVGDMGKVQPWDLGTTPVRLTELGLTRAQALERHVKRLHSHVTVMGSMQLERVAHSVDAAVVVHRDGLPVDEAAQLATLRIPALPVVLGTTGFQLGPISAPREDPQSACIECCVQLWPMVEEREELSAPRLEVTDSCQAAVAAALAVQQLIQILDERTPPPTMAGQLRGCLKTGFVEHVSTTCEHLPLVA